MPPEVLISEVGPRDGLQSIRATMPTAHKRAWISALHAAGLRETREEMFAAIGNKTGAAHTHNTRALGLANCLAAWDAGVRTFDSSLGGLGGCPCAPGASGNVVTEDLVFMFEAMGLRTGVDINQLVEARTVLQAGLPGEPIYGMTPDAGLPLGFVKGAAHV